MSSVKVKGHCACAVHWVVRGSRCIENLLLQLLLSPFKVGVLYIHWTRISPYPITLPEVRLFYTLSFRFLESMNNSEDYFLRIILAENKVSVPLVDHVRAFQHKYDVLPP